MQELFRLVPVLTSIVHVAVTFGRQKYVYAVCLHQQISTLVYFPFCGSSAGTCKAEDNQSGSMRKTKEHKLRRKGFHFPKKREMSSDGGDDLTNATLTQIL